LPRFLICLVCVGYHWVSLLVAVRIGRYSHLCFGSDQRLPPRHDSNIVRALTCSTKMYKNMYVVSEQKMLIIDAVHLQSM
jgi:hypothetical protein